jgi:UDP:flavonoid glycosyltransferase YjiC (YdhE family)
MHARYVVGPALEAARGYRPDLIVSYPLEFSGLVVGGVLGVPVVHHRWGIDPIGGAALPAARRILAGVCSRHLLPDGLPEPVLTLDPCPPALQSPFIEPAEPIRFVPFNGAGPLPGWARTRPVGRRRVCVSLGRRTITTELLPLLHRVIGALDELGGVETVITADRALHGDFGALPASVRLVEPVPLDLFLSTCDAVVHHGGSGTALTACRYGLPQLVLPQMAETAVTGERLAATGAGITVDDAEGQGDQRTLRDALEALLDDSTYAKAGRRLAEEMAAMPSPSAVVARLEAIAEAAA